MQKLAMAGWVFALLPICGCNARSANEENLKAALQADFDQKPRCAPWFDILPIDLDPKGAGYQQDAAKYEALRAAGLVTSQTSMKVQTDPYQTFLGMKNAPTPIVTYSIGGPNRYAWSSQHEICYAKLHVTHVENFTEPSQAPGFQGSRIAYTYELTSVPAWAKAPVLQEAIPQIKTDLQQPEHKGSETMVLTNNGWKTAQSIP